MRVPSRKTRARLVLSSVCMAVHFSNLLPCAARAQTPAEAPRQPTTDGARPPFGRRGQFVLDEVVGLRAGGSSLPATVGGSSAGGVDYSGVFGYSESTQALGEGAGAGQSSSTSRIWFAPAFDWFVVDHLSLGVGLAFELDHTQVTLTGPGVPPLGALPMVSTWLSAMPRVGWAFEVTRFLSLWPRVGVGYAHGRTDGAAFGGPVGVGERTFDESTWMARADVGLVFDVMPHVFLSATPELTLVVASQTNADPGSSGSASSRAVTAGGSVALGLVF